MKFFLVALIAAASHLVVYAQEAPKTITIQVGNPTAPTQPEKLQFNPRVVAVNPGDTVVYTSNGVHRVREQANFTLCSPLAGSTFDSGPLVRGSTWTVPPQLLVPGKTIIYYCPEGNGSHCASPNNMQGALVVRGLAGGAAGGAAGEAAGAAPTGAAPAGGAGAGPKTITVEVGKGGTKFVPDNVSASPGDTVMFTWVGGNHNVVPSDAPASCVKSAKADSDPLMQALASGAPKTTGQHSFLVPATAQVGQTLNYYCGVATHCSSGKMYASINIVAAGTAPSAPGAAGGSPTAAGEDAGGAAGGAAPGADGTDPAADPAAASASTLTVSTLALTFAVVVSSLMV